MKELWLVILIILLLECYHNSLVIKSDNEYYILENERLIVAMNELEKEKDEEIEKLELQVQELEDYITYIYCPLQYGGATYEYKYLKNHMLFSSHVTLVKIMGEEIKFPPMKIIDCR